MKHLKLFAEDTKYKDFINGAELPNVSYVKENNIVYYNPFEIPQNCFSGIYLINEMDATLNHCLLKKMNGTDDITNVTLFDMNKVKVMKINGNTITPTPTYIFSNEGEYEIYVEFTEKLEDISGFFTLLGNEDSTSNVYEPIPFIYGYTSLDLSNFDVSNVTNMCGLFVNCRNLTSLDLSNWDISNVTNMNGMFAYCYRLTSLDLTRWDTANVNDMGYMFNWCSGLTEIRMGGNVSSVNNVSNMFTGIASTGTFYYNALFDYSHILAQLPSTWTVVPCTLVDGVLVPLVPEEPEISPNMIITYKAGSKLMEDIFEIYPFKHTNDNDEIVFCEVISHEFNDGVGIIVCDKDIHIIQNMVFSSYLGNTVTQVTLPNTVKSISECFTECETLTAVTLSNSLIDIGDNAFSFCPNLISIEIPNSVKYIGPRAFELCEQLQEIVIPENVVQISSNAFNRCLSLTSVTFNCQNLDMSGASDVFYNCSKLKTIICNSTNVPLIDSSTFWGICENGTLYYPYGSDYSEWLRTDEHYLGYYGWTGVPCTLVDGVLVPNN